MSCLPKPAEAKAPLAASTKSSSAPLSQCSAKRVHPIPMMATRSFIPCDAMTAPPPRRRASGPYRASFPEIVGDTVGSPQPPEGQLDAVADGEIGSVDIGELDR